MIELAFAIVAIAVAFLSVKTENFAWKNFFFLMFFFFVFLIPIFHFYETEKQVCVSEGASYCLEWQTIKEIGGKDAIVYGFGMLVIVVVAVVLISIVLKGFESAT